MKDGRDNLIRELAEGFWKDAGLSPIYPIQATFLEQAMCLLLPIDIVRLSKLSAFKAVSWLAKRKCKIIIEKDSPLCGLLFINQGQGIIFLNGALSPADQCYTLAHELGHYLLEFEYLRKKAGALLDDKIEDVFWGARQPTIEEEITGLIRQVKVSPYIHLLEEKNSSTEEKFQVWEAEDRADAMAFELLAPLDAVFAKLDVKSEHWNFTRIREALPEMLSQNFGLPGSVTKQYAAAIAYYLFPHGGGLIEYLKQL